MDIEKSLFLSSQKSKKELAIKSLEKLPKNFSLPENPKAIILDPSKEGDIELIFLEDVKINLPEYSKVFSLEYKNGEVIQSFQYKETNYTLKYL